MFRRSGVSVGPALITRAHGASPSGPANIGPRRKGQHWIADLAHRPGPLAAEAPHSPHVAKRKRSSARSPAEADVRSQPRRMQQTVLMSTIGDLVFVVGVFAGPLLVLSTCVLLRVTRQPRWVFITAVALSAVMALAWVTYWYAWGKAFDYADTYSPVPLALDRASNVAVAVCFMSSMLVAALGASRLVVASNKRGKSGLVPST